MIEYVENKSALPNFATPVSGRLREVLDNDTTTRNKIYLNGLGITNGEYLGVSMMLKTRIELAQDYTVFNKNPKTTEILKVPRQNNSSRDRG